MKSNIPTITKETIKAHIKAIQKAEKSKSFKSKSNKVFENMMKENPALVDIIMPTLESKKPEDYKKGYLAGITTIYDVLKRESKKGEVRLKKK